MAPAIPSALERPHFIGVGGAGMSGIARILAQRGAQVSGSDARASEVVEALRTLGVTVRIGHDATHLPADASAVVVSSAIRPDNPELATATARGVPIVHRSDALAALMDDQRAIAVAGTHGKTTTTSMLAVALRTLGLDPSYAIGGDLDEPGTNAHHGTGDLFVAEADESDRSFHAYAPQTAIVLNVELDHHANYASIEEIHASFETFVGRIRPGGTLVVAADHAGARELAARVLDRPDAPHILSYGESADADVRITGVQPHGLTSEVTVAFPAGLGGDKLTFTVAVPGRHYAHNAVAALTAGAAMGVPLAPLAEALGSYTGVRRRLQLLGTAAGVQVIDSYAHHPTEISADLEAVRAAAGDGRVLVLFQPHLFSRTRELGAEMGQALAAADAALVLDVYPAREDPIPGVTSALVTDELAARGAEVVAVTDLPGDGATGGPDATGSGADPTGSRGTDARVRAVELVAGMAKPGDLVLTMGAGDVTELGPRILTRLEPEPQALA